MLLFMRTEAEGIHPDVKKTATAIFFSLLGMNEKISSAV
jgi:hypothetical protein